MGSCWTCYWWVRPAPTSGWTWGPEKHASNELQGLMFGALAHVTLSLNGDLGLGGERSPSPHVPFLMGEVTLPYLIWASKMAPWMADDREYRETAGKWQAVGNASWSQDRMDSDTGELALQSGSHLVYFQCDLTLHFSCCSWWMRLNRTHLLC